MAVCSTSNERAVSKIVEVPTATLLQHIITLACDATHIYAPYDLCFVCTVMSSSHLYLLHSCRLRRPNEKSRLWPAEAMARRRVAGWQDRRGDRVGGLGKGSGM